jgi:hypothetical protein
LVVSPKFLEHGVWVRVLALYYFLRSVVSTQAGSGAVGALGVEPTGHVGRENQSRRVGRAQNLSTEGKAVVAFTLGF